MKRRIQLAALVVAASIATFGNSARATNGLSADFNSDDRVDDLDLAQWNANFAEGTGADADGNGLSDGMDFLSWQRQIGSEPQPASAMSENPEPATLVVWGALAAIVGIGASMHRRRSRSTTG
jgi:hypothetical protein